MSSRVPGPLRLADIGALSVARCLLDWAKEHGYPSLVLSDQGAQFRSDLVQAFCELTGSKQSFTTAYHPQTDGEVERFNQTLLQLLRAFVEDDQRNWDEFCEYSGVCLQ